MIAITDGSRRTREVGRAKTHRIRRMMTRLVWRAIVAHVEGYRTTDGGVMRAGAKGDHAEGLTAAIGGATADAAGGKEGEDGMAGEGGKEGAEGRAVGGIRGRGGAIGVGIGAARGEGTGGVPKSRSNKVFCRRRMRTMGGRLPRTRAGGEHVFRGAGFLRDQGDGWREIAFASWARVTVCGMLSHKLKARDCTWVRAVCVLKGTLDAEGGAYTASRHGVNALVNTSAVGFMKVLRPRGVHVSVPDAQAIDIEVEAKTKKNGIRIALTCK